MSSKRKRQTQPIDEVQYVEEPANKIIKHIDPFFVPWEDRLQGDDREELNKLKSQSIPSRKEAKKLRALNNENTNESTTINTTTTKSDLDRSLQNKNNKNKLLTKTNANNNASSTTPKIEQFQEETPDQKRLRLAKEYMSKVTIEQQRDKHDQTTLGKLSKSSQTTDFQELIDHESKFQQLENGIKQDIDIVDEELDDDDEDDSEGSEIDEKEDPELRKALGKRLHEDAAKSRRRKKVVSIAADRSEGWETIVDRKAHEATPTCLVLCESLGCCFTAAKDGTIIKWDLTNGNKLHKYGSSRDKLRHPRALPKDLKMHIGSVHSLAISDDSKFLASGGYDKVIRIWNAKENAFIDSFKGHKLAINCLAFRGKSHELFSGSNDRTVKIWEVEDMAFIDTLYGHQEEVICIDSLEKQRAVSAGTDKTCRLWKVPEESQLVFKGVNVNASLDCLSMIDESKWVAGGQDGTLSIWSITKKKPLFVLKDAHPVANQLQSSWICSVHAIPYSDLIASGAANGEIILWKLESDNSLTKITSLQATGFVNGLKMSADGNIVVAAIGRDPRLGRWESMKEARNSLKIFKRNTTTNTTTTKKTS